MTNRKPLTYVGVAGVAAWFGVLPATVTKWMQRHPDYPAPDALIEPGRRGRPDQAWLPGRRADWQAWKAALPGQGAGGGRPPRQPPSDRPLLVRQRQGAAGRGQTGWRPESATAR
jgi:hypothetical protein